MALHETHSSVENYKTSGFGGKMGWGMRPALLIIDVCTAYWTEGSPLDIRSNPSAAASPDSMRRLLEAARAGGCPVFWTTVYYNSPTLADAGLFFLKSRSLDVWKEGDKRGLGEWMPGLVPDPSRGESVIVKKYPSGFFGTTLSTELQIAGVDTVVLCGVSTSGCVRASTLDAMCHGFRPMVSYSLC